jgi:crotonobetainyl-CoA:carnitine CoA-transferase CaiB-like acyl-CoA transferase
VLLDYEMNGRSPGCQGNADELIAPHNVYQCWGVDRWVAIVAETDEEFGALAEVIGHPELATGPRFADADSRKRNEGELDRIISEWTRARDRDFVANTLARAGVAAAPSRGAEDLFHDPHLQARGAFVEIQHPELGPRRLVGPPWKMSECEVEARHAPLLGEHNDYVFRELLGMSDAELAKLQREGVVR